MTRTALITGITGQDGAYLAQLLLEQGYTVYGGQRRSASGSPWRLEELGIAGDVRLLPLELLEQSNLLRTLERVRPDELYNLAAQSHVGVSFDQPVYTGDVDGLGPGRLLEAVRTVVPGCRFYQASTSELFGNAPAAPQSECTPFRPCSPYGAAKLFAHWLTVGYREAHGLYAVSGILFNHESPLRGLEFVTRRITAGLARIRCGQQDVLELGNLGACRDWGAAPDYVRGMWLMLEQERPSDYVLATGRTHSVRAFVDTAAACAGMTLAWQGDGATAYAVDRRSGKTIIAVDPGRYRPSEVARLVGDASRAKADLGWEAVTPFEQLVATMVEHDLRRAAAGTLR